MCISVNRSCYIYILKVVIMLTGASLEREDDPMADSFEADTGRHVFRKAKKRPSDAGRLYVYWYLYTTSFYVMISSWLHNNIYFNVAEMPVRLFWYSYSFALHTITLYILFGVGQFAADNDIMSAVHGLNASGSSSSNAKRGKSTSLLSFNPEEEWYHIYYKVLYDSIRWRFLWHNAYVEFLKLLIFHLYSRIQ